MKQKLLGFAVAAMLASAASAASAAVTFVYNPATGAIENTGAAAKATFTFTDHAGGDVNIEIKLENLTDGSYGPGNATAATLVGIAFDLPTLTSALTAGDVNANGTAFSALFVNPAFVPFTNNAIWGPMDFNYGIGNPGANFHSGNPAGGALAGQTKTFFVLADSAVNAAAFEAAFLAGYQTGGFDTAMRFQQVSGGTSTAGSDKVRGGLLTVVPEPGTWALMIMGFGGAGAMLRRRREHLA